MNPCHVFIFSSERNRFIFEKQRDYLKHVFSSQYWDNFLTQKANFMCLFLQSDLNKIITSMKI